MLTKHTLLLLSGHMYRIALNHKSFDIMLIIKFENMAVNLPDYKGTVIPARRADYSAYGLI